MSIELYENLPDSRPRFERTLNILVEVTNKGNLNMTETTIHHGLDKVRRLPNGRFDFLTVNEGARNIANMVANKAQLLTTKKTQNHEGSKRPEFDDSTDQAK